MSLKRLKCFALVVVAIEAGLLVGDGKDQRRALPHGTFAAVGGEVEGAQPRTPKQPATCGVERWAVKTLSDDDAPRLKLTEVSKTTIAELNLLPAHCQGGPDHRVFPEEFKVYEVVGRVRQVMAEQDRDVHIVLADPNAIEQTIVIEVADPNCSGAADSPHAEALTQARSMFTALLRSGATNDPEPILGRVVRVRGVGFFDFDHGQAGRSQSCIELHPVVSIEPAPN